MKKRNVTIFAARVAAAACAVLAITVGGTAAARADAPFCLENYSRVGPGKSCTYYTFAQCIAATSGVGGSCSANPWYRTEPAPRERRKRRHHLPG